MNLRAEGLRWFRERFGEPLGPIYVSRYYPPSKSWTGHGAWAFEIPPIALDGHDRPDVFLVLGRAPGTTKFRCLRIPAAVFLCCEPHLYTRPGNKHISLFLSAESMDHLVEKRGSGAVRFAPFAWDGQSTS